MKYKIKISKACECLLIIKGGQFVFMVFFTINNKCILQLYLLYLLRYIGAL